MKTFTLETWTLNKNDGLIFTGYTDVQRNDLYGAGEVSGAFDLSKVAWVTVGTSEFGVTIEMDLNGCHVRLLNFYGCKEPFALAEELGLDIPARMRVRFGS